MKQPARSEIDGKLKQCLRGSITREDVSEWALCFIRNDSEFIVDDVEAWHYLVAISNIDEMVYPGKYLYSMDDIKKLMKK